MGQTFRLIAENALETENENYDECHVCGHSKIDLYNYSGYIHTDNETKEEISVACANCILTKKLSHVESWIYLPKITAYLDSLNLTDKEKERLSRQLIDSYQRTPDLPMFMQQEDRPFCCQDITEFIGIPNKLTELIRIDNCIYWDNKPSTNINWTDIKNLNISNLNDNNAMMDISVFECSHCGKKYFTYQPT